MRETATTQSVRTLAHQLHDAAVARDKAFLADDQEAEQAAMARREALVQQIALLLHVDAPTALAWAEDAYDADTAS